MVWSLLYILLIHVPFGLLDVSSFESYSFLLDCYKLKLTKFTKHNSRSTSKLLLFFRLNFTESLVNFSKKVLANHWLLIYNVKLWWFPLLMLKAKVGSRGKELLLRPQCSTWSSFHSSTPLLLFTILVHLSLVLFLLAHGFNDHLSSISASSHLPPWNDWFSTGHHSGGVGQTPPYYKGQSLTLYVPNFLPMPG